MIIKNNFNDKDVCPLNDYHIIGKGSNSLDKKYELEKEGHIQENLNNPIIQDVIRSDFEYEEDDDKKEDKWDFFK